MQEGLEIPGLAAKGLFSNGLKQHELGHRAGFPPSKDTEGWVEFSSLARFLKPKPRHKRLELGVDILNAAAQRRFSEGENMLSYTHMKKQNKASRQFSSPLFK